jgi:hypothetical protein
VSIRIKEEAVTSLAASLRDGSTLDQANLQVLGESAVVVVVGGS